MSLAYGTASDQLHILFKLGCLVYLRPGQKHPEATGLAHRRTRTKTLELDLAINTAVLQ